MAPAQPLFLMWTAIERETVYGNRDDSNLGQGISVEEAYRGVTINVIWFVFDSFYTAVKNFNAIA